MVGTFESGTVQAPCKADAGPRFSLRVVEIAPIFVACTRELKFGARRDTLLRAVVIALGVTLFFLLNAMGMGIALACLALSHYVFGFTSPLADNISANVIGLAMANAARFVLFREVVFSQTPGWDLEEEAVVSEVIRAYRAGDAGIVIPRYGEKKGHPIIINVPKYRQAIANLPEEAGLNTLMQAHADDVRLLDVATDDIIRDIDVPDDYTRELARYTERRSSL